MWRRAGTLTPPQLSVRARSLPVPSGSTATGGCGLMPKLSITERTQPAVPSPPQMRMRRFDTLPYNSSLKHGTTHPTLTTHPQLQGAQTKTIPQEKNSMLARDAATYKRPLLSDSVCGCVRLSVCPQHGLCRIDNVRATLAA